jgi:HAD superfamily hydrolase (TIGR01509 family)
MMSSFDTILFDMDGLMLDTERIYRLAWQQAAVALGYHLSDDEFAAYVGVKTEKCEELFIESLGRPVSLETLRGLRQSHWDAHVGKYGIPVKPGLLEFLEELDGLEVSKGVVTSTARAEAEDSMRQAGIGGRFDCITTGDEVTHAKPAPDIYLLAASRLGATPDRCIVFEDSEAGVQAGSAAGMRVIMIPDLKTPSVAVAAEAYAVMASLFEASAVVLPWLDGGDKGNSHPSHPGAK